jgi:uncharacterized protein
MFVPSILYLESAEESDMNSNPVVWFEIYVSDMERARRFYESVFETKLEKLNSPLPDLEMWSFPSERNAGGAPGALVKMEDMSSGGKNTIVYFSCKDCAVEERRVAQFGGSIHRSKTSVGEYGQVALVYDTEGNMLALHSM